MFAFNPRRSLLCPFLRLFFFFFNFLHYSFRFKKRHDYLPPVRPRTHGVFIRRLAYFLRKKWRSRRVHSFAECMRTTKLSTRLFSKLLTSTWRQPPKKWQVRLVLHLRKGSLVYHKAKKKTKKRSRILLVFMQKEKKKLFTKARNNPARNHNVR